MRRPVRFTSLLADLSQNREKRPALIEVLVACFSRHQPNRSLHGNAFFQRSLVVFVAVSKGPLESLPTQNTFWEGFPKVVGCLRGRV